MDKKNEVLLYFISLLIYREATPSPVVKKLPDEQDLSRLKWSNIFVQA